MRETPANAGTSIKRLAAYGFIALAAIAFANLPTVPVSATDANEAAREFQDKRPACSVTDVNQLLSVAAWAVEHSLFNEADQVYRDVLDLEPANEQARAILVQIASRRKLPRDSAVLTAAKGQLPPTFAACESAHFIVLSDAGLIRARKHAELLERAEHQFRRFTARLNLQPLPLQHKLVCVLFRSVDDYREFASAQDGVNAAWVTGYYTPANDRIVFYDAELAPPPVEALNMIGKADASIALLEGKARDLERSMQATQAQSLRRQAEQLRQQREETNQQVGASARATAVATAVHEAVHQLLYHTRVQSLQVRSPLWISEGLATNFETDLPNQAFGPDHECEPRRADFDQYLSEGRLLPLPELVQIDELSTGDEHRAAVVYAQSYALVKWMCRFRAEQLRIYLDLMRVEIGEPSPERHLELFQSAFGDAAKLEHAWLRFERDRAQRESTVSRK